MSLNAAKTNDVPIMKNLKAPPSCVKLAFGAMCVIIGVAPEKIPEAQAKKNVTMKCHLVAITNAPYKGLSNLACKILVFPVESVSRVKSILHDLTSSQVKSIFRPSRLKMT